MRLTRATPTPEGLDPALETARRLYADLVAALPLIGLPLVVAAAREALKRAVAAVEGALEGAGMTIPWPIRTLLLDVPVEFADRR